MDQNSPDADLAGYVAKILDKHKEQQEAEAALVSWLETYITLKPAEIESLEDLYKYMSERRK